MSSWKWLPMVGFLICLINMASLVKSDFPTQIFFHFKCDDGDSYANVSTYKSNLDSVLSSISTNIDSNGFYNASTGENRNIINVIALCRADLQPNQCRDYVKNASAEILTKCPNKKQAILWHEFCMVRYSDKPILGTVALNPYAFGKSGENVSNPDLFYKELNILLDSIRQHAAFNSSPKKFAGSSTRNVSSNSSTIYAFEQCTPDITPKECDDCLKKSSQLIRECCDGARGVRILRPSCYLRFETDPSPFYNESMVDQSIFRPPTPPGSSGKGNSHQQGVVWVFLTLCWFSVGLILM